MAAVEFMVAALRFQGVDYGRSCLKRRVFFKSEFSIKIVQNLSYIQHV
mgnify:CR=1 FL=1